MSFQCKLYPNRALSVSRFLLAASPSLHSLSHVQDNTGEIWSPEQQVMVHICPPHTLAAVFIPHTLPHVLRASSLYTCYSHLLRQDLNTQVARKGYVSQPDFPSLPTTLLVHSVCVGSLSIPCTYNVSSYNNIHKTGKVWVQESS